MAEDFVMFCRHQGDAQLPGAPQCNLAGALGGAFLQMALSRKWVVQDLDSRALAVTPKGRKALAGQFGLQSEIHDDALSAAQGRAVNAIHGVF